MSCRQQEQPQHMPDPPQSGSRRRFLGKAAGQAGPAQLSSAIAWHRSPPSDLVSVARVDRCYELDMRRFGQHGDR